MEHLTHGNTLSYELGACCVDVVDGEKRSLDRARHGRRDTLPKMTEHCEPGGVSCTARQSSPAEKSASSRHPRLE